MKKEARILLILVIIFLAAYFMPFSKAGSRQNPSGRVCEARSAPGSKKPSPKGENSLRAKGTLGK
jgi:hypothetical protein